MRIPDVSAIRFLLIAAHSHGAAAATSVIVPPRSLWKRAIPMVATAVVAGAIAAGAAWTLKPSPKPVVARLTIPLPEGQQFSNPGRQLIAISPDGTHVVYVANLQLYLRSMWESEPRPIPGTDAFGNVLNPVFSPDGHSIGFIASADRTLKRIAVTGGTAVTVCPASAVFGMSWSGEDILFGQPGGVVRVSASGGKPELLLSVMNGEIAHGPQMLPGGDAVLFTLLSASSTIQTRERWDKAQIVVHSLKTGERKTLIEGGADGRYLATGHLVYALGGVLFGVPFDLTRLTIAGVPTPIVEGVRRAAGGATGTAQFSISTGGSLVYLPGPTTSSNLYDLGLLDLKGGSAPLKLRPGPYQQPRISPDSKSVAFHSDDGKDVVVWVYDLSGVASMRRLTLDGRNRFPVWSGDGQRVTFQSDRDGDLGIFWQRADGTGKAERLTKSEPGISHVPETWSPDGKFLLFSVSKDSNWTLWMYSLHEKSGTPLAGINSENPISATFSRDGRWFAYSSRGRARGPGRGTLTYVQPFPANGTKYEIGQGSHPMWSADSKQLFAAPGPGVLGSFTINTQPHFAFGNFVRVTQVIDPEPAFPRGYDMGSDGKVLGLVVPGTTDSTGTEHVQVVLNWFEELRQRVPLK